jgi:aminopeptidase N
MKSITYTWVLSLTVLCFSAATASGQTPAYSTEDSVRGTITPERKWWNVSWYDLDLSVDPDKKWLDGNVTMYYKVLDPYQVIQMDLQPPLRITRVVQDGVELEYEKKGQNAYMVRLKKPQEKGQTNILNVTYSGHPIIAKNPPWQGGFQFTRDANGKHFIATSCQGLGASAWWPNKDHSYDEPDSILVRITVPPGLVDISNGRLTKTVEHPDGRKTFWWRTINPINNYGVNVNIGDYVHFSDTLRGEKGILDLNFYVLPYNLDKAREHFKQAKLMLKAFEYWFGPYPFYEDGYKLVETPYLGMEHQSSVTYGNGYQNGYRGRDLSGTGWGLKWDFIIIHESGHEWFANNITYKDIADMWIHESFTNYSESLFTEYYYGKEAGTDYVVGTRSGIRNDTPIIGVYNVNQAGSGDMYPKGGNLLHTIRHSIGNDSLFRSILRGLNKTFYHQTVETRQIEDYISSHSHIDFSKVFDQYLRTTKIPVLEYLVNGKNVQIRWSNAVEGFNLQLLTDNKNSIRLKPTTKWTRVKTRSKAEAEHLIDPVFLKRMYYVEVQKVAKQ